MFSQDTLKERDKYFKQYFYTNGIIASEGFLKNEKPTGYWKSYYVTGIKKSEGLWNNNVLDSIWVFYDQLGDTIEKVSYFQGKKNGFSIKYFLDDSDKNKINSKELYLNGQRNGNTYFYYPNGKIKKVIPYLEDKKNGISYELNSDSIIIAITRYRNNDIVLTEEINRYNEQGEKEGVWKLFYNDGKLKEERTYKSGKLNGYVKQYNNEGYLINAVRYQNDEIVKEKSESNSNIEIKEEYDSKGNLTFQGGYSFDKPIGIHRYFNSKGEVIKAVTFDINGFVISEGIVFTNGVKNGKWIEYYENKKIKSEGYYNNDKKDDKWIYYFKDGKIQQTGNYSNGKLTGKWEWYHENGMLLLEETFIYGLSDGISIEYSEIGEVVATGLYIQGYKEGEWIYKIGDMVSKGKYVMGEKDGLWQEFYNTGNIYFEGRFVQGKPDGKHIYYYPNTKIFEERYYNEGVKIKSWAKYKQNGDLLIVVQYKENREYKVNGIKTRIDKFDQ